LIRPVGPLSQNGKAWPKVGKVKRKAPIMKRSFISRHSEARLGGILPFPIKSTREIRLTHL
jgi:hypothetical protein